MTGERLQLHSSLGRRLLLAQSYLPWVAISGCLTSVVVAASRGTFGAQQLPSLIFAIPFVFLAQWARRNATPVFATPEGLELAKRKRIVPWAAVATCWRIPFSGLLAVQRITFSDGTPPLTFYCNEDLESIVRRFKAKAPETPRAGVEPGRTRGLPQK